MQKTYHEQRLEDVEQKISDLINSKEYKDLATKNRAWVEQKPTEEQRGALQMLLEQLAQLKEDKSFWQNAILASNSSQFKKQDSVRKRLKEAATKSERAILSSFADHLYTKYEFETNYENPTFGDVMNATGFKRREAIRKYFSSGKLETDELKDYFDEQEWIYLVELNHAVNQELHSYLKREQDGTTVVVLEDRFYDAKLVTKIMVKTGVVEDAGHLDIKNAESDSSTDGSPKLTY
jgi:hypothetical protein